MKELRDVVGYENFFSVTEYGDVWSKRTNKFLKFVVHPTGYKVFCTKFGGRKSQPVLLRIHRLVATTFIDNIDNKPFVNHKDGNKLNNHVSNLEWVTARENNIHAINTGLTLPRKGHENKNSEFGNEEELIICAEYSFGDCTHRSLGLKYGVHHSTIGKLLNRYNDSQSPKTSQ